MRGRLSPASVNGMVASAKSFLDYEEVVLNWKRVRSVAPARELQEKLKGGDDLIVGGYRYRLREKFLKRYPANGQLE